MLAIAERGSVEYKGPWVDLYTLQIETGHGCDKGEQRTVRNYSVSGFDLG